MINLGAVYGNTKKHETALMWFDRALNIEPDNAMLMVNKSAVFGQMKKYQEAEYWLQKALQIHPNYEYALRIKDALERSMRESG